jgi:transposase-like protein
MVTCPHCKEQTSIPGGFDYIDAGRFACEHCRSEFLIINNVPMTEEQYRQGSKVQ